jgi:hypothetical protein
MEILPFRDPALRNLLGDGLRYLSQICWQLDDSTAIQTRRDEPGAPTTSSSAVAASVASLKRTRDGHVVLPPATWLQRL